VGGAQEHGLIVLDVLGGAWLVLVAVRDLWPVSAWFYVMAVTLLLAHAYREWEYLAGMPAAFCANGPLFVFNNVRLLGLVSICVMSLIERGV
jgi:hypothetical protein